MISSVLAASLCGGSFVFAQGVHMGARNAAGVGLTSQTLIQTVDDRLEFRPIDENEGRSVYRGRDFDRHEDD